MLKMDRNCCNTKILIQSIIILRVAFIVMVETIS